jgi:hypothetical protein
MKRRCKKKKEEKEEEDGYTKKNPLRYFWH